MNLKKTPTLDKKVKAKQKERSPEEMDNLFLVTRVIQQNAQAIAEQFSKTELEDLCKHLDKMRDLEIKIEQERAALVKRLVVTMGQI